MKPDYQDEQKVLCQAATAHARPKDTGSLERLFATGGWQTLLTIAESSGTCEWLRSFGRSIPLTSRSEWSL